MGIAQYFKARCHSRQDWGALFGLVAESLVWIGSLIYLWNRLPLAAASFFSFAAGVAADRFVRWIVGK
ncbi:hypothetical protein BLA39750_01120 [Burkholderia lata]|uniref:Uncharacterized protein n=1 Tax=Burkholderia lata (strain ATCC 17760 / DSM 23089 / LMG 22485 / NCIMB 9086 / R18194 / 383) TaxID=482957 RepID=A0A6P2VHH0_BURL3|nr:hypothetical protein [Burkholderia lata]VWC79941.1 hypothetical protein BLA39750_01120 [Burkholderia lata]